MPTYEEAMAALRKADAAGNAEDAKALARIADGLKQATTGDSAAPDQPEEKPQTAGENVADFYAAGPQAVMNMASGMVAKPVADIAGLAALGKEAIFGGGGDPKAFKEHVQDSLTYQPRGKISQAVAEYNPVALIGKAINKVGDTAGDVVKGKDPGPVRDAMGNYVAEAVKQAPNILGAKYGPKGAKKAGEAVEGIGGLAGKALPKVTPETAKLAQKADAMGIKIRPDMLSDNKFVKLVGELLDKVPLSGSKGKANEVAFNQAVIKEIGGDPKAQRLTPEVFDKAIRTSGAKIGEITKKNNLILDGEVTKKLDTIGKEAANFETSDVARVVNSYISEIKSKANADGIVPGIVYRRINTKLSRQIRNTADGDMQRALSDVQEGLLDSVERNMSGAERNEFRSARMQYAKAKTLIPLVAKSPEGNISPAGLMGRVTSTGAGKDAMARGRAGGLGDIARVGQRFLKEPGSSNTTERSIAAGALGIGAAVHLPAAAATYTLANLYNRAGPALAKKMVKQQALRDAKQP